MGRDRGLGLCLKFGAQHPYTLHATEKGSNLEDGLNSAIAIGDVKVGMFVVGIDRSWLDTPFPIQGFLVENAEQVATLRHYCSTVFIDRTRSVGDQYSARLVERDDPLVGLDGLRRRARTGDETRADAARLLKVAGSIHNKLQTRRQPKVPRIHASDGRSRLESELLYSAPIIDDVYVALRKVRVAIEGGEEIDIARVEGLVGEMASGIERNPDALIWLTRLKRTDHYTYDHAVTVSVHLMVFARFLGFSTLEIRRFGFAGLLQDIGKIQVDYAILAKTGALSPAEFDAVKAHVSNTVEMFSSYPDFDAEVLNIIAGHHERFDGTGYPKGLEGIGISLPAEMAGVVDTYCAMTEQRVYRNAVSSQRAMETLNGQRDKHFRDTLIDQFLQCIGLYPVGTLVELNSGEVAVVIQQNQVRRLQPRVLVLLAADKSVERYPRTLELLLRPEAPDGEPYRILKALPPNAYGLDPADFYLA